MSYKVVLFDADGMLFDFHKAEVIAFTNMLKDHKINYTDDLFSQYMEENKAIWEELEQGIISQEELKVERFHRFLTRVNITGDKHSYAKSFMHHLSHASILFENALDVVKAISKHKEIVIVTNGLKEVQDRRVRRSVLAPYVKCTVISDELSIAKPNPKIIDYALEQINHKNKDDVIIIGDSLTSDIQGGINAGIDTCWYNAIQQKNNSKIIPTYEVTTYEELYTILN